MGRSHVCAGHADAAANVGITTAGHDQESICFEQYDYGRKGSSGSLTIQRFSSIGSELTKRRIGRARRSGARLILLSGIFSLWLSLRVNIARLKRSLLGKTLSGSSILISGFSSLPDTSI
jgi:hypothetical protein